MSNVIIGIVDIMLGIMNIVMSLYGGWTPISLILGILLVIVGTVILSIGLTK